MILMSIVVLLVLVQLYVLKQLKKMAQYKQQLEQQLTLYSEGMEQKNQDLLELVEGLLHLDPKPKIRENALEPEIDVDNQDESSELLTTISTLDLQGATPQQIAHSINRPVSEVQLLIYLARKERDE